MTGKSIRGALNLLFELRVRKRLKCLEDLSGGRINRGDRHCCHPSRVFECIAYYLYHVSRLA